MIGQFSRAAVLSVCSRSIQSIVRHWERRAWHWELTNYKLFFEVKIIKIGWEWWIKWVSKKEVRWKEKKKIERKERKRDIFRKRIEFQDEWEYLERLKKNIQRKNWDFFDFFVRWKNTTFSWKMQLFREKCDFFGTIQQFKLIRT